MSKEGIFLPLILLFFGFIFLLGGIGFMFISIQTFNESLISGHFLLLSFLTIGACLMLCLIISNMEESK